MGAWPSGAITEGKARARIVEAAAALRKLGDEPGPPRVEIMTAAEAAEAGHIAQVDVIRLPSGDS